MSGYPLRLALAVVAATCLARGAAAQLAPADSARVLSQRAWALKERGGAQDLRTALALFREAAQLFRRAGRTADQAYTLNSIGVLYNRLYRPDSALLYYRAVLPLTRVLADRVGERTLLRNIAEVSNDLGLHDSALAAYRAALPLFRSAGDRRGESSVLAGIGVAFYRLGRLDSALVCFRAALLIDRAIGDRAGEAVSLLSIGVAFFDTYGLPDSALAYFSAALAIRRELSDRAGVADLLADIGNVALELGRTDSALACYRAALAGQRAVADRRGEASTLQLIAGAYGELARPDSVLAYFRAALLTSRAIGDRQQEAAALGGIGLEMATLGRADSAIAYFRMALPVARAAGAPLTLGGTLNNIGFLWQSWGRGDSALPYHRAALGIFRAHNDRLGEAMTLSNIGVDLRNLGRPDSAVTYTRAALAIERTLGNRAGEIVALSNLASLYRTVAAYRSLPRAVATYDTAAALIASVRSEAGSETNRISYLEQRSFLSASWALTWLAREQELGQRVTARAALAAAERGRAQALLDLLRRTAGTARGVAGVGDYLTRPGADLAVEAESLVAPLRPRRTAALSYLVTEDTLVVWLLTPRGDVHVVGRVAVSADTLRQWVYDLQVGLGAEAARGAMARGPGGQAVEQEATRGFPGSAGAEADSGRWVRRAARLAQWLVPAAVVSAVPAGAELVIVPHGVLGLVPFALLPVGDSAEPLGLRYALRYVPSLASLRAVEAGNGGLPTGAARRQALRGALVVGNPAPMPQVMGDSGTRGRLQPLPGAEQEAGSVARQLGVTALVETAATETAVRARLPGAPLVHLATHGLVYGSEARVRASYVALAKDSVNDGFLTLGELVDDPALALRAELVVLSACQTGLGDLKQAEGTVGFQRGLLARGARSVLVSLWSVNDQATAALMEAFYGHWLDDPDGPSKAEALRRAERDVRGMPAWADPRYWAAFQLVGAR